MQVAAATDDRITLSIRYEGGDASRHTIDLHQLGVSLQGLARVLAVSAHFVETGKYNKQFDTLSVRVVAEPVEEHNCYELVATIMSISGNLGFWSGLGTTGIAAVVGYVFNRRKGEEMKHLSAALNKTLDQQATAQERMLATIERLADALQPAVRQALAPIGQSVESINLRGKGESQPRVVLDRETKELAAADKDNTITESRQMSGIISELDMLTGSCKVALGSDPSTRVSAKVVDPVIGRPNNPYVQAMAQLSVLDFIAKAEIDAEGEVVTLFISDCTPNAYPFDPARFTDTQAEQEQINQAWASDN